jgi:hypothetical protein
MELDSLKYLWKGLEASAPNADHERELGALMRRRSAGPVARMQRNLYGECLLVLITYIPAILWFFMGFEGHLAPISWLFMAILAFLGVYFFRKNRLLKEMQCVDRQVRSNLQTQVDMLRRYTRFYVLGGTIMIPLMAISSYFIIRWQFPPAPGAALFYRIAGPEEWWKDPQYWALALGVFTVAIYFVNAWYVRRLYGQHIRKLQAILDEMDAF